MALRSHNVLALCAGVGGLDLGITLALHCRGEVARGICYVEREAAAAASLVASMEAGWLHPAPVWSDLLTFDARRWRGLVHILASGDPCQDNSVAGKGAGSDGERFLAPEVCRIADECRPDLIFRENVPGNAAEQLAAIAPPLERMGYRIAAGIFSSAETGNTMRRERLFIMAERFGDGHGRQHGLGQDPSASGEAQGAEHQREWLRDVAGRGGAAMDGADGSRRHPEGIGQPTEPECRQPCLAWDAMQWPGPAARDFKGVNSVDHLTVSTGSCHLDQLPNFVEHVFRLPSSPDQPIAGGSMSSTAGPNCNQHSAKRKLNPIFVEALMRWPTGLSGFERQETAWTRWWLLMPSFVSALVSPKPRATSLLDFAA